MNLVRQQLGKDHVNGMVRRALAGERNCFYAIEGGHVVGTPFDWTLQGQMLVSMSALTGEPFVAAVRERDGGMVMGRAGGVGDGTH